MHSEQNSIRKIQNIDCKLSFTKKMKIPLRKS